MSDLDLSDLVRQFTTGYLRIGWPIIPREIAGSNGGDDVGSRIGFLRCDERNTLNILLVWWRIVWVLFVPKE